MQPSWFVFKQIYNKTHNTVSCSVLNNKCLLQLFEIHSEISALELVLMFALVLALVLASLVKTRLNETAIPVNEALVQHWW